jgi:UDP-N-acetyl-D-mannosaminuronic acid dehydrogenase
MNKISKISVIGLGYIGLPTAAMFAARGVQVVGVDINRHAVDTINQGKIHIVEPELDMIVHAAVTEGYLRASTTPEQADAFLIAVPTPFKDDHIPDLSYVRAAAESVAPVLKKGDIVILESTSPVGTTEELVGWLAATRTDLRFPGVSPGDHDVCVAYCPERVLPGHVVRELVQNDKVIGGITDQCSKRAKEIYRIFVEGELLFTNARTAEMCKLTENASRDVSIAFANELSMICGKLAIDVRELIRLANHHPRVNILSPGAGVGGHCIAVDPWFIVNKSPTESRIIRTAREVNDTKPHWVAGLIQGAIEEVVATRKCAQEEICVALLGLSFKPDIDDLRESPAVEIALKVASFTKVNLLFVEPHIDQLPEKLSAGRLCDLEYAVGKADVIGILVAHDSFRQLSESTLTGKRVIDPVGILS